MCCEKMEIRHIIVCLSVLGIIFLYFLSIVSQPVAIQLNEIPKYEGKQVVVEGMVVNYYLTNYGGQIIEIEDTEDKESSFKTTVFSEEEKPIEAGDRIQVIGKVQKYQGSWEIVVNNRQFITILEKWQNISIPLWELARNPDRYVGTNINVSGFIGKIYGDYFYLVDSEDEYSIIVFYNPLLFQNFSQGDKVCITARVTYNEENLRYDLQADERIHNILILEGK